MARSGLADLSAESAPSLLQQLRRDGIELAAPGGRLRIWPAARVTPELREVLAQHTAALVALLQPATEFVTLKGGLTIPVLALQLALDLESRGFPLKTDDNHAFIVFDDPRLTARDRVAIDRWRLHLGAIVEYQPPLMS